MLYLFLFTIIIFLIAGFIYLLSRLRKIKIREQVLIDTNSKTQKAIQQMIHNIKNPLATLAMAIHNLQCSTDSFKEMGSSDLSVSELYETINESVKDTTTQLNETAIFCRSGRSHFRKVDAISFIENNLPGTETPIKVITDFPDSLPNIDADQQALDLVVQKLLSICKYKTNHQLIIHISVSEIDLIKHTIEYKFFSHKLLSRNGIVDLHKPLNINGADEHTHFIFSSVQTILARHNSNLLGHYDPEAGSVFIFQLNAITG